MIAGLVARPCSCPGLSWGDGVIVGAGAVVGGKIPDYAIVLGNPAQIKRMRFDKAQITMLKNLAWWRWPLEKVRLAIGALEGEDLSKLAEIHRTWRDNEGNR